MGLNGQAYELAVRVDRIENGTDRLTGCTNYLEKHIKTAWKL